MGTNALRGSGIFRSMRAEILAATRTKPDVASGVCSDKKDGRAHAVEYRPGNGITYSLVLTDLSGMGVSRNDGDTIIWVKNFSRSLVLPAGEISLAYVQDQLRCSITDAVVVAELLGWLTGREGPSVETFIRKACA